MQTQKQTRRRALDRQIRRLNTRLDELNKISDRYTWIRLAVFGIGVVLTFTAYFAVGAWLFGILAVVTVVAFSVVVAFHRRIRASITRYTIWRHIKLTHIARMTLDWTNLPAPLPDPVPPDHPFAIDFDLTGDRSVHRLLDTATSREGSKRLRDWLLSPIPDPAAIQERQHRVRELAGLATFRDKLILNATLASKTPFRRWEASRLLDWLDGEPPDLRPGLILLAVLAAVNILLIILNASGAIGPLWRVSFVIYAAAYVLCRRQVGDLFDEAKALSDTVNNLKAVFEQLERTHYGRHPHLKQLCQPFLDRTSRPSTQLRRIAGIVSATSIEGNPVLWLALNAIAPWDMYFAYRLSQAKADIARLLPGWLNVWFELEALSSLATFGYLNPAYTLPVIREQTPPTVAAPPAFRAANLGHPLIPDERKVCNDFAMDHPGEIVIVTGSNMAGKSSFLRTLGVNLCLAYAGGPVNADELQIALFRLFACIKVTDSVTDGFSYFYAEVKRLKALLDELQQPHPFPVFFLIDEIFKGTNNRERLVGSRAYIRALAGSHGLGVISTHDLELVRLSDEIPAIRNCHFREEVIDGQMVFDYRLRSGPCPTTNALKIMQMEGLPIEPVMEG